MSEHEDTYEAPALTDYGTIVEQTQQIDISIIIGAP